MIDSTPDIKRFSSETTDIKINEEYAKLVPPLTDEDYNGLKNSIKNNGLHETIKVNSKGEILDGHHRFRLCQELGIPPKTELKEFANEWEEKLYVIDVNFKRRHLTTFQKLELASLKEPILKEIANKRMLAGVKLDPSQIFDKGRVDQQLGKDAGVSHETVRKFRIIEVAAPESVKEKLRSGELKISKVCHRIQVEQFHNKLRNETPLINLPSGCKPLQGDFMEVGKQIPDNSIPLIVTDPPYDKPSLYLYENLGIFANRVLKEGGSLVTYIDNLQLEAANLIEKSGLKHCWIIAVKMTGHQSQIKGRGTLINVAWKPMFWFIKGNNGKTNTQGLIVDYVESEPPDKMIYEWEQSTVEAEHIIKALTVENQIVLDPMMGSGTTGEAALKLNRKFIGIELNQERFTIAQRRLSIPEIVIKK